MIYATEVHRLVSEFKEIVKPKTSTKIANEIIKRCEWQAYSRMLAATFDDNDLGKTIDKVKYALQTQYNTADPLNFRNLQ